MIDKEYLGKKYVTIENRYPAEIVATDMPGGKILVIVDFPTGRGIILYGRDLKSGKSTPHLDLVEDRRILTLVTWLNVYRSGSGDIWATTNCAREAADLAAGSSRVACLRQEIDFYEGSGL